MSKYDGATIEVVNFEAFNPRNDSKKPTWFRLENTIATGPGFFGLDCEQKWLWVVILSLVSQKTGRPITWNSEYIQAITGIKPKKQDETLEIFEKFVRLRVSRAVTSRDSRGNISDLPATDGRTDGRTEEPCDLFPDEGNLVKPPGEIKKPKALHPLAEIWNQHRGSLPRALGCSGPRLDSAQARWKENPSTEYWAEVVTRMSRSAFCRGEKNKPGPHEKWKADFDFLIQPNTHFRVLEGKYDDTPGTVVTASTEASERAFDQLFGTARAAQ